MRKCKSLSPVFFKIILASLLPLCFLLNLRITLSISRRKREKKKPAGVLIGIMLNL